MNAIPTGLLQIVYYIHPVMSLPTEDAPKDLKELKALLDNDNKVKVAGKYAIYADRRIAGDIRFDIRCRWYRGTSSVVGHSKLMSFP